MNLQPIADRVIIEPIQAEEKTSTGIYIPETAKEKPSRGTVVAVGVGKYSDISGGLIPMQIKKGDTVLYGKHGYTELPIDGKDYLIMRESDIHAIL